MSESTAVLLPLGCFVLFAVACFAFSSWESRRRTEGLASLATLYGTEVTWLTERSGSFVVTFGTREIEVRDAYTGGGLGSSTGSWPYLTLSTTLRGRAWDLHAVDITRRRTRSHVFEDVFKVHDLGMPMREGWLTPAVRSSIAVAFEPAHPLRKISIEAGKLVFVLSVEPRRLEPATCESLLSALTELATQVERSRPS